MTMHNITVPCETCLGTGKRTVFMNDKQPTLPLSVIIKAAQVFQNCTVEEKFDSDGFVLRLGMKGTYEEMVKKQDDFHQWLHDNYPDEVSHHIVLTVRRVEAQDDNT